MYYISNLGVFSNNTPNNDPNFYMNLSPPPPPKHARKNCGELRDHHNGMIVEMDGKVIRTRLGRFIELKDQYGITQLVAPVEVRNFGSTFALNCSIIFFF